jgi:hypothetical protein
MRLRGHRLLLCVISLAAAGCYKYTAVETPQVGMEVRAQLENEAAVRHSSGLDEPIMRYDGVVVAITPDTLALNVLVARSMSAFQDVEIRDTLHLPRGEVRAIMQRKIAPLQTALVVVAAGAAAVGIVAGIDAIVGGTGDDDGEPPPPQSIRVPLFSLIGWSFRPAFPGGRRED